MTETGYRYGVCALRAKRAEIAGDIAQIKIKLRHHQRDLAKVDDILRLLDPGSDPAQIPPKKAMKYLNVFRQGELGMLVLGILRAQGRPMTHVEIAQIILRNGGFDSTLWPSIRRRARANLAYLEFGGRVTKSGTGPTSRWALN